MMGRVAIAAMTLVLFAMACEGGLQDVLAPDATSLQQAESGPRPWLAHYSGGSAFDGPCAGGEGVIVVISGEGTATHIGRSTVTFAICFDLSTGLPIGTATGIVTAANGDEIHVELTGAAIDPDTGEALSFYDVIGGTGRFASADGEITNRGTSNPDGTWSSLGQGWISF